MATKSREQSLQVGQVLDVKVISHQYKDEMEERNEHEQQSNGSKHVFASPSPFVTPG